MVVPPLRSARGALDGGADARIGAAATDVAAHAWEALDPDGARKRADILDKRVRPAGPLHGIPLAVKDIIATRTLPTTCGSAIYRDHVVGKDADCVTRLVRAGAIVLGKAVTTEFAGGHGPPG